MPATEASDAAARGLGSGAASATVGRGTVGILLRLEAKVGEGDVGAETCQLDGGLRPDPVVRAGDEGDPPAESPARHALLLLLGAIAAETLSAAVDDDALHGSVDQLIIFGRKVEAEEL